MKAQELREKFIRFFEKKGHKRLPSASLVPEDDPLEIFINSGMHPLVPFLLGQPHPEGKRLTSVQKCLRTDDIDDVGDTFHHTFFEMLGNWSLGDYFKEDAIKMAWDFITKELKIPAKRLSVSCFAGDKDAPRDEEAAKIWQAQGIPKERIYFFGKKDNWWAVGKTGPCGPDTEIFYDIGKKACGPKCQPGCSCGKYFEIWNLVFMIYNRQEDGSLQKLKQKNVDTGMGLERTLAVLQGKEDDYQTELFASIIKEIEEASGKKYEGDNKIAMRIIADHLKAAVFLVADGVEPTNKGRGYILRRLIRRTVVKMMQLNMIPLKTIPKICQAIINIYGDLYFDKKSAYTIHPIIGAEVDTFIPTIHRVTKLLQTQPITSDFLFDLHQSYGLPFEFSQELLDQWGKPINKKIKDEFEKKKKEHQEKSRTASKGMFKGGLADHSEKITKFHTATHLLHSALREVLGEHVQQVGSNITSERLRFDFTHPEALTEEELKKIEDLVNGKIKKNLRVKFETLDFTEAKKAGALAFFGQRYPEKVKVYSIGKFSKEVCAGPHVDFTGKLGKFIIKKEESSGAGKRRIYAVLNS